MTPADDPRPSDSRLLDLALRITDESPVDWEEERRTATDLSEPIEHLREIQSVAAEYRRPDEGAAEAEAPVFVWGALRALEKLGEGGFGEVWRAWDPALHREVALKLCRPEEASRSGGWLREAQRLARVRHPHVLTVHGADVHDGRAGLWTDLIRGRTLEQLLLEQGPLSPREASHIGLDLCAALAAVHGAGLVHGDVKARNVFREGLPIDRSRAERAGRIVLMDFGTATERGRATEADPSVAGTPLYAAPEILRGEVPSVASDLYALGVLLFRLVTGGYPIEAASMSDLRHAHERGEQRSLRSVRPDLPAAFVGVVERALAPDPSHRFRDAAEMERALAAASGETFAQEHAGVAAKGRSIRAFVAGLAVMGACWLGVTFGPRWLRPTFTVAPRGLDVAVTVRQVLEGSERIGQFGYDISASGDLDGDGISDLLVGEPLATEGAGRAYFYRGKPDGTYDLAITIQSPSPGGQLGFSVAHLGDINADGAPDFALGAVFDHIAGRNAGGVFVYFGGEKLDGTPDVVLAGTRSLQDFGFCVANVGDLNGDGHDDLAVGAPIDDAAGKPTGRVFVFYGGPSFDARPDLELSTVVSGSQFGIALAGLGDFNGDGSDDFAVGANWDRTAGSQAGRVFVYYGGASFDAVPDLILSGRAEGDWFGVVVQGLGDVNGDGLADMAVGADFAHGFEPRSGTISVYFGGDPPKTRPALVLRGEREGCFFSRIGAVGDLNGDGSPDLVCSAPRADGAGSGTGAAYVFFGGPVLDAIPDVRLTGGAADSWFGVSSDCSPNPNREAFATLIIGAGGFYKSGAAYVYALTRHAFRRPLSGDVWAPGSREVVTWMGQERADLSWSGDNGRSWKLLASRVGGRAQNTVSVMVPQTSAASALLRLARSGAGPGEAPALATVTLKPAE